MVGQEAEETESIVYAKQELTSRTKYTVCSIDKTSEHLYVTSIGSKQKVLNAFKPAQILQQVNAGKDVASWKGRYTGSFVESIHFHVTEGGAYTKQSQSQKTKNARCYGTSSFKRITFWDMEGLIFTIRQNEGVQSYGFYSSWRSNSEK